MATCKECLHFEPCRDYGNILDPIHGGMICDSFKPAADVVEVVRCKDCKYAFMTIDGERARYCDMFDSDDGVFFDKNHFCSYGERK